VGPCQSLCHAVWLFCLKEPELKKLLKKIIIKYLAFGSYKEVNKHQKGVSKGCRMRSEILWLLMYSCGPLELPGQV
jgi:hypothetical protein